MATTMLNLPEVLVKDILSKVQGHSAIARLCGAKPLAFNGEKEFVFNMPGEAAIVAEGGAKPASNATFTPVVIRPLKFVYQARVSDEFVRSAEEARMNYLKAFADGFAVKIARGLDIAAMHGVDPKTGTAVASLGTNNFDGAITGNVVDYDATKPDDNLDAAVQAIVGNNCEVNGLVISPAFGAAMATVKVNGVVQYPEFRFGGRPEAFAGYKLDVNNTLAYGDSADQAIVGDFANAFRWGYAANIPMKVIEYGDPDGAGRDLQQFNEVCLRAEAYIGWGILDAEAFAIIKTKA